MPTLLAVDLGLRSGLATYADGGRLLSYRSHNYGSHVRLKRGAWSEIARTEQLTALVVEGDAQLAQAWARAAEKRNAAVFAIQAQRWRETLLDPRDRRSGADAKRQADVLARRIIERSGAKRPTSLRHDAAEAILIGWWGCMELGWVEGRP